MARQFPNDPRMNQRQQMPAGMNQRQPAPMPADRMPADPQTAFYRGHDGADMNPDSPFPSQPAPSDMTMLDTTDGAGTQPEYEIGIVEENVKPAIGVEEIRKAMETLRKYKAGKSTFEDKVVKNEKWWKMRHWDLIETKETFDDPKPASGWLFNTIISKHADYMDAFPSSDVLPREEGDMQEAKTLSSIIPVVMDQVGYKKVYSEEVWSKLKDGTGIFGVFWDKDKLNGLGDISITNVDPLTIFWEPGIKDIQDSQNIFTVELVDNDVLKQQYPDLARDLSDNGDSIVKKYMYDENISTADKTAVIDWYYKKRVNGKKVLHYVKFFGDHVLYSTENDIQRPTETVDQPVYDPATGQAIVDQQTGQQAVESIQVETGKPSIAERGLYDHGLYPFVFDVLFPEEGMPTGFGFVDVCKHAQTSIDIYNNAFEKNVQFLASPRYLVRNDGGINEEEFSNPNCMLIHTDANLGTDSYAVVTPPTYVNSNYINILDQKISEMKETAGNRDANNGGSQSGVTAASAIAAMQESAGKTSRDQINTTYEAHKEVVNLVIELIRQFYDMPRQFRITGDQGQQQFVSYTNQGMQPQYQGQEFGVDMGYRLPVFDVKVTAEKESAYSQLSQNELALQFYNLGFFNPQLSDQALATLDMMEFQGKQQTIQKIQANGTMYEQMIQLQAQILQMSEIIDKLTGNTNLAEQTAGAINQRLDSEGAPQAKGAPSEIKTGATKENAIVTRARQQANASTQPR